MSDSQELKIEWSGWVVKNKHDDCWVCEDRRFFSTYGLKAQRFKTRKEASRHLPNKEDWRVGKVEIIPLQLREI